MKKNYIRKENGFATSDALIAVLVIVLFSGLIATLTYNIYLANTSTKRISKANGYITDIFEYVDKSYYDDISIENIANYFNNKYYYQENTTTPREDAEVSMGKHEEELTTPFKILLKVENYYPNPNAPKEEKLDLVKEITITVKYKLGRREQEIEISRAKARENIVTPNPPDLALLNIGDNTKKVYCVKKITDSSEYEWEICEATDNEWYNYEKDKFPTVFVTRNTNLTVGSKVDQDNLSTLLLGEELYEWTPRYAENSAKDRVYLFKNSNRYVKKEGEYNKIFEIDESYTVPTEFDGKAGNWRKI